MSLDDPVGRRLLLAGWYVLALVLVFTAVLNSIARLPSSLYQDHLPAIQENISSLVGKPVQIREIHVHWYGYTPLIAVDGLSVYSDERRSERLFGAEKALISLNLKDSLLSREPVIEELQLSGSDLHAVRDKDHRIMLNGIDISERLAERKERGQARDIRFSLLASTIAIRDEVRGYDYHFDEVDIVLRFHEEKLRISTKVRLPDTLGDSLALGADLAGLDRGLNHIRGELYTKGENINLELLGDFFPQLRLGVQNGRSDFEVWGDLVSEQDWSFEGRLAFHDLEYRPVADPPVGDGQEITALDARFRAQRSGDTWQLAFIESDIRSAGVRWAGEQYEVRCTGCGGDAGESTVAVALEYFDTSQLLATLQHFPVFAKGLRDLPEEVRIGGQFTGTRAQFRMRDGQPVKYAYRSGLQGVTVSVPAHGLEIASLSGEVAGDHLQGSFSIDSPAVRIRAARLKEHAFPEPGMTGRLLWELTGEDAVLGLENVTLQAGGLQVDLQGVVHAGKDGLHVDIQAGSPAVRAGALRAWLPAGTPGLELMSWLEEGERQGSLEDVRLLLQGDPRHIPFARHPGRLEIHAGIRGIPLGPQEMWPGTDDAAMTLRLDNQRMNIHGDPGQGSDASIRGFDLAIDDILQPRLVIRGELELDAWLNAYQHWLAPHARGTVPVSASIDLPPPGREGQELPLEIRVESDLTAAAIALPEPFGKEAGTSLTLGVHSRFRPGERNTLQFNYGNRVFAKARLDAEPARLSALEIRAGDDRFELPDEGIRVSGKFEQLDVNRWEDLIGPADTEGPLELREVDIRANTFSSSDLTLTDVSLSLEKDVKSWTGSVHSQTIRGTFEYPLEPDAESLVAARLDYLHVDYFDEEFATAVNPRDFPALDIHVGEFELDDLSLNNVTLRTEPSARGMVIDSLTLEGDSYRLEAGGTWDMDVLGVHHTDMAFELAVRNLHDTLIAFGQETAVSKGKGVVTAKLNWPGMPDQFALESFAGTVTLRLRDGEITTVDPGAGRLVGLINLAEISRRLTFDFSDFFSEGYVFDKIRGTLVFKDGNLTTEDLRFDGPSADMRIAGRTGIMARDYDQIITMTPNVTGGLPWLGIGLGPVGVGGIYILGKVGQKVGIDVDKVVDKVVEVKYHMTGSWEDPQIEPVAQKIADSEPPQATP